MLREVPLENPKVVDCPECGVVEHTGVDDQAHCPCNAGRRATSCDIGRCDCPCHEYD